MRIVPKTIVAIAAAAMLVTAFAKSEHVKQDLVDSHPPGDRSALQANFGGHGGFTLLAAATSRVTFALRAFPSFGAVLAGATLLVPFGFSTYRTLRGKSTL